MYVTRILGRCLMIESWMQQSIVLTTNGIIIFHIKLTELASFGFDYQAHSTYYYYYFWFQMQCLLKSVTYLSKYGRSIVTITQTVKSHLNGVT